MTIYSIKLENFQGIKNKEFRFYGKNNTILGDNATGKTTLLNAHCWLLFGRAGDGQKGYTPQTSGDTGKPQHNLDHTVEEVLTLDDGARVILRKVYHEVYKKQRGSITVDENPGHTSDYYINGVPVKEAEYLTQVADLCGGDIERGKLLSLPAYFASELPWTQRREYLLGLCGDISDDAVIASSDKLADLPAFMAEASGGAKISVDSYKAIIKSRAAAVNDALKKLPGRIDEADRATPKLPEGMTRERAAQDLAAAQSALDTANAASIAAGDPSAALAIAKAATAEAKRRYVNAETDYNSAARRKFDDEQRTRRQEADKLISELSSTKRDADDLQHKITRMTERRTVLAKELEKVAAEKWDPEKETCPTCGQALPHEQIEKLRGGFNANRSRRLQEIQAAGKREASKDMIEAAQNKLATLQTRIADLSERLDAAHTAAAATQLGVPFIKSPEGKAAADEWERCSNAERDAESAAGAARAAAAPQLVPLRDKLAEAQRILANIETADRQRARVAELEAEEKQLGAEYERLDRGLWMCEEFIRRKVDMLTDSINAHFKVVRFRLFVQQVNGGLREDCEVLIPSPDGNLVPYTTANNGAKINAGLEIIATLSALWGLEMPIFVDNAESITNLHAMDAQTIALRVSSIDKDLRIETLQEVA
jgi:hypothetical protein